MPLRNPLLKLEPRRIRTIMFGERSEFYRTGRGKFEVRFSSRREMEQAVREWLAQAGERGLVEEAALLTGFGQVTLHPRRD